MLKTSPEPNNIGKALPNATSKTWISFLHIDDITKPSKNKCPYVISKETNVLI